MFDEKNIYVRQAEIKGCIKQNNNGIYLISDLTINSSLKNYKQVLHKAFQITIDEINLRNHEYDCENKCKQKEKKPPTPTKKEKTGVKQLAE